MKIIAIVLAYNCASYIEKCLDSLKNIDNTNLALEIVVVDNKSSDGVIELITNKYPDIHLIQNQQNLGYAEGNNVGIRYALEKMADFVWIVNPDVYVAKSSLQKLLIAANQNTTGGIFGSKIYFAPGYEFHKDRYTEADLGHVLWYAGGDIDWASLLTTHRGVDQVDKAQFDRDMETDFVTGACMFIKKRVFETVGLFDAKYFLYFEENDFCQRAKRAGWQLMYVFESQAWHANAQATGIGSTLQDYYITRNRLMFGLRYAPTYTKLLLIKEAFHLFRNGRPWQKRAIMDYVVNNFGSGSYQPD